MHIQGRSWRPPASQGFVGSDPTTRPQCSQLTLQHPQICQELTLIKVFLRFQPQLGLAITIMHRH